MADPDARKQAIKQASQQVRTGSAFVRRAAAVKASTTGKPVSGATKKS